MSPVPTDSALLIPFWTGFSLGLLRAQLGSLDSLSSGLMFLIPASHVYLSHGYPLPSSIIKQAHNLFFSCNSFSSSFLKSLVKSEGYCEYGMGHDVGKLAPCYPLFLPLILLPLGLCPADRYSLLWTLPVSLPPLRSSSLSYHFSVQWVFRHLLKPLVSRCPHACFY